MQYCKRRFDEMHLKYFIDVYMDANELLQNKDQYDIVFGY